MKPINRRTWLRTAAFTASTAIFGAQARQPKSAARAKRQKGDSNRFAGTLRDRLWISVALGNLAMTPAESALYLGLHNVILTGSANGQPLSRQLALSLTSFTQVVWPTNGYQHFVGEVRLFLAEFPNITGVLLDCSRQSIFTEVSRVRDAAGHRDLWASINSEWSPHEPLQCSVVLMWPGNNERLEALLSRVEMHLPAADIMLGCSLEVHPESRSKLSIRSQCELARKAIHDHRIRGLVFDVGTGITGESELVPQTREWIGEVGGQKL